ncbi:MAG: cryptochrome/photolyase family protein [Dermatophilaceae bacterium]
MSRSVLWFRRDLRLQDHPALHEAAGDGQVVGLFVLDPRLLDASPIRTARLFAALRALDESMDGALVVRRGTPSTVVAQVAREAGATAVHVTAETTPYGRQRDAEVARSLQPHGIPLVETGTPYAVDPGQVLNSSGAAYQVFTPYRRAWREHGWPPPTPRPGSLSWVTGIPSEGLPEPDGGQPALEAGEAAALERWHSFRDHALGCYDVARDRPDLDATSRLSIPLKYGEIHPRTILVELGGRDLRPNSAVARYVSELCWREFYADVLWHRPQSAWGDLRMSTSSIPYADPSDPHVAGLVEAWRQGRTGYPLVDAGMRQLLAEGWMHNRVRMVTASFLVKDLHVWWPLGARHFMRHLLDGDLASNNHGWQWTAGTGTDAAPYYRVFNPVSQGLRFDPLGGYVRRWVPELAHLPGASAHQPWLHRSGYDHGYPERVLDHDSERVEALARYARASG